MLALGCHCSAWGFSCWGSSRQASAVVAHGLSCCTSRPQSRGPTVVVHGISCSTTGRWELHRPGTEPVSPALAGDYFTTEPPGKPTPHIRFLNFVVSDQGYVHLFFQSSTSHRCGVCVSTPSECSWHWAEIIWLHICLTPQPDCLWKAESQGLAHFCTFISSTWLHIHYTCTDGIMSSHRRKYSKLPGRAFMISRYPGRATKMKRSPHCLCLSWTVSVRLLSHVWLFVTPWTTAHQACLSITNSQSLPKLMSIESVMQSNHLILCHPLLLPSIFPSIRVFSNESALPIRWPKY